MQKDIATATAMCRSIQNAKETDVKRLAKFLVEKTASYPDFIEEIVAATPNISYEWLIMVRKIGYGHVFAPLLAYYQTPGVRRVSRFEISKQKELWKNGVLVAVPTRDGFIEKIKSICNLTGKEVWRVFAVSQTRTIPQQVELVAQHSRLQQPAKKYTIRGTNVAMTRCVLSAKEIAEIATKVLCHDDLIEVLAKVDKKAA